MADETERPASDDDETGQAETTSLFSFPASGEAQVALAGLLVVVIWLVFDVLIDNYGINDTLPVLGAGAALVRGVKGKAIGPVPKSLIMKGLGYAIAMFGLIELILDIRFTVYDNFGIVIAALLGYGAFVLAFIGARSIKI